jgi:transcriptional regulator GlxA family with amidase domain
MIQVSIVLYPGVASGQVCGIADYFRFCNDLAHFQQPDLAEPLYQVQLMEISSQSAHHDGMLKFECQPLDFQHSQLIVVPGSYAHNNKELSTVIEQFSQARQHFTEAHQRNIPIAASCNGSFALAATGLLDGKTATTCWFLAEFFRYYFPQVQLEVDHKVAEQDGLYTAGATNAYIQLCLALTQLQQGVRFSQQMAKIMLTDPHCSSQTPYLTLSPMAPQRDDKILQIQQYLQEHLAENIELSQVASHFAMTQRTLIRRFKQSTGDTPMAYLQKLRIEKAKQLLESSQLPIEQLLNVVGYEDLSSFRKLFQQYTSLTPKAYRERFYLTS